MKNTRALAVLVAFVVLALAFSPTLISAFSPGPDDGRGTPFILDRRNNICGLDDPRQLSFPAKIDYQRMMRATPHMKKMREEKIDPDSPQGIQLRVQAAEVVREKCELIRKKQGHCSIWKKIRRRDGNPIPDVSSLVLVEIQNARI